MLVGRERAEGRSEIHSPRSVDEERDRIDRESEREDDDDRLPAEMGVRPERCPGSIPPRQHDPKGGCPDGDYRHRRDPENASTNRRTLVQVTATEGERDPCNSQDAETDQLTQ